MRVCILGATGLVGRETLRLVFRAWPRAEVSLFASRDQTLDEAGQTWSVRGASALEGDAAPRGDLAFVALDDDHSRRYVPRLLALGYRVVDKSNTYRMDDAVPLVVAGVNHALVTPEIRLVANPNCTSIPLALALAPIADAYGLEEVTVSTYQAVSGAGVQTLDAFLEASQKGYAEPDRLGARFDARAYAGNVVPHSGGTDASGFSSEERKMVAEGRKILQRPNLSLLAQCTRVPVAVGHYQSVWVTLGRPTSLTALETLLREQAAFVHYVPGPAGEGLEALSVVTRRDEALVGRLRQDPRGPAGTRFCLTVVGDNLRLGAATNAVRIATAWFASADPDLQVSTRA